MFSQLYLQNRVHANGYVRHVFGTQFLLSTVIETFIEYMAKSNRNNDSLTFNY